MDIEQIRQMAKEKTSLLLLFGTLALFLITNTVFRDNPSLSFIPILFGILIFVEIVALVGLEVKEGAHEHGWKHEIVDTVVALAVAVVIWYGASFLLNTSAPISGVVSCSMLPNLQRGDFIIVQGAPPNSYHISMTKDELAALNTPAQITYGDQQKQNITIPGSIFVYCNAQRTADVCQSFLDAPENFTEKIGPFTYHYGKCPISFSSGQSGYQPCVESITFHGTDYKTNFSNDVIVYQPNKGDYYSLVGDIVHRAMFSINVDNQTYYLTRGDNNPILDVQAYEYANSLANHPVPASNVRGKVIFRIPILGYFKLFIMGYFQEDPQCKTQLSFDHIS